MFPLKCRAVRNLSDTLRVLVVISEPDDLGHIQWNGIAESIEELKKKAEKQAWWKNLNKIPQGSQNVLLT